MVQIELLPFEAIQPRLRNSWLRVISKDPALDHPDLFWYSLPGLRWLQPECQWRKQTSFTGKIDPSFDNKAASTSAVYRLVDINGESRVVKELLPHTVYYTNSPVAQAVALAGEQAIGTMQFPESTLPPEEQFYQGIYKMKRQRDKSKDQEDKPIEVSLTPYQIGDELESDESVVSLMREVDSQKTAILQLRQGKLSQKELAVICQELVTRALFINIPIPNEIRQKFASEAAILARVNSHTPGGLRDGLIGTAYPHLQTQAARFITAANKVFNQDRDLREYLLSETYARRGGDVRLVNTILDTQHRIEVVLDQISLFLDPNKWEEAGKQGRVLHAPWGINSSTYEVAFIIPDLLATNNEDAIQEVVSAFAEHQPDFVGQHWGDLKSTAIRALRFWVAIKTIEMTGFSTFNIQDPRIGPEERAYLEDVIFHYGEIAHGLMEELDSFQPK